MDKSALKKLAIRARRELLRLVSLRASLFGLTPDGSGSVPAGKTLTREEGRLLGLLRKNVREDGFETVMEDAACTWFIRFAAFRLMEINGFLPTGKRLLTDRSGRFVCETGGERGLFRHRLLEARRELSGFLPDVFGEREDERELLLPDDLMEEGSVLCRMVTEIPEECFDLSVESGQIGVMGRLYQYYMSEKHEAAVDPLHGGLVGKEQLPAATQLFTTDWIVRFLTDNSLGRYWTERNPGSRLAENLPYLVPLKGEPPACDGEKSDLRDATVFDPCVGSGHFLMYAFDLLVKIYAECGRSGSDAACEIVKHHLFGLDIDRRVVGIARFCVMMKARWYDADFFSRGIRPRIYTITESGEIDRKEAGEFRAGNADRKKDIDAVLARMTDAKEYGSLLKMPDADCGLLRARAEASGVGGPLRELLGTADLLSRKYAAVVTNPPYFNRYDEKLKAFLAEHFREFSGDLFSVFMQRNAEFCGEGGYSAFVTPYVWMFIRKYEAVRREILDRRRIVTLIQFEYSAYEDATVPLCAFVLSNDRRDIPGGYFRLTGFKGGMEIQRSRLEAALRDPEGCGYYYSVCQRNFRQIPSAPLAFWADEGILAAFRSGQSLGGIALARNGMKTGDNRRFLRFWWEVPPGSLRTDCRSFGDAVRSGGKWFPYNKGGEYRKWYGNNDYVVDWENAGERIFGLAAQDGRHVQDYPDELKFAPSLTWSLVSSGKPSFRYKEGCLSDIAGMSLYGEREVLLRALGLLNSIAAGEILQMLAPTINFQAGDIARIPVPPGMSGDARIPALVEQCIAVSREDWDSRETSWDFHRHPLVRGAARISDAFDEWRKECESRFRVLKACEKELNRVFLAMYGLEGRLSPEVSDGDISLRRAELSRDVRSLISYAVGCMTGRFTPDRADCRGSGRLLLARDDGIIPLSAEGGFENDVMKGFRQFLRVVYGEDTLEENLRFAAGALGRTGAPEEVLRGYLMNQFFADHCALYRKRPVYWLIDSGRRGSFRCLVYLHSLRPDTADRILEDYVRPLAEECRRATRACGEREDRELKKLREKEEELRGLEERLGTLAGGSIRVDADKGVLGNYQQFSSVAAAINSQGKKPDLY